MLTGSLCTLAVLRFRLGGGWNLRRRGVAKMAKMGRQAAFCFAIGLSLFTAACGGGGGSTNPPPPPTTYTLTVNSTNPASGVAITASPADVNGKTTVTSGLTFTYDSGVAVTLSAPATSGANTFVSWSGGCTSTTVTCNVTMNANASVTANYAVPVTTYTLTVNSTNPSSGASITASPADINGKASGNTSASFILNYDAAASVTLTAPATSGSSAFSSWSNCTSSNGATCTEIMNANATVTANYTAPVITTPSVTVTPSSLSIATTQGLTVTVAVSGSSSTPTGSVGLTGGGYTSNSTTLSSGGAQITIPASSLTAGSDTLKATYTPDLASSSIYNSASGTSAAITVITPSTVTVSTPSTSLAVHDQLLGMNMAVWYDIVANKTAIVNAFQTAGIKAVRWPGGSASDDYHWATNSECASGYTVANDTYLNFVNDLVTPAGLDVALTANYGTDTACTGGGDPAEAAAWLTQSVNLGVTVSHMTVGNEVYGSWETDDHAKPNDPATYAAAVAGSGGYYPLMKAASAGTQVGVVVDADNTTGGWDNIVLSNAKGSYDFVEYHYYPQGPGLENDTTLIQTDAQQLTANLNTVKAELAKWGTPNTPIYVGEMGSVYTLPGRQSSSITQALFAGQTLGEMMNAGVSRATWWIGFGGCDDTNSYQLLGNGTKQYANFDTPGVLYQTNVYGWQNYGGYMVFSDGLPENGCASGVTLPAGTLLPTARAFQLFSNVAVSGESVLTATVGGDTADIVAYAATHGSGTALVVFNRNETASKPVEITLSGQTTATSVTQIVYDKAIYDQTDATTPVWAPPTTTTITSPALPLTLMLTPWSMNVVIIK